MDAKDFVPLLATLVGGVLTTAGGFIASYKLNTINKSYEKQNIILHRLEEVYALCDQLKSESKDVMKDISMSGDREKTDDPGQKSINRLTLIVHMYFPSLKPFAAEIKSHRDKMARCAIEFYKSILEGAEDVRVEKKKFFDCGSPSYIDLSKSCENLQSTIVLLNKSNTLS